ncbi:glycosyltransferase [Avibacterium volantium]|uniref:glycosyltransferase n=1 Tax=Avibacterium TaxID=292486 RepID=UPI003BF828D8
MNSGSICAVIVTYNRKLLLVECLKALLNQSQSLNAIYIINNANTDGTENYLKQ